MRRAVLLMIAATLVVGTLPASQATATISYDPAWVQQSQGELPYIYGGRVTYDRFPYRCIGYGEVRLKITAAKWKYRYSTGGNYSIWAATLEGTTSLAHDSS